MYRTPTARLITAEEAKTQREVNKFLREIREKQERENLERSLIQQGKLAPVVTRDLLGRPTTKWIGSVQGFLKPFSQQLLKANLHHKAHGERQAHAREQERAFFEQAGRDALKPQPSPPPSEGKGPPRQKR